MVSTPQEGEPQTPNSRNLMELLARRNAIDICGAVSHMATDLLHRAHSHSGKVIFFVSVVKFLLHQDAV